MKFLNKPVVKNVLLGVLTLIIGGLCSFLGTWDFKGDSYFIYKIIALIVFALVYIIATIYYCTNETNTNKVNKELVSQNKAYEEALLGLISICKQNSSEINTIIHSITNKGEVNLQVWSFDKASKSVCVVLYSMLCNLHGDSKDFFVGYVRLIEDNNTEKNRKIYMSAYACKNNQSPSIYKKQRNISEYPIYFDAELFTANKSDTVILMDSESINDRFSYMANDGRKTNKGKYNQYIAIPVFCNDTKMVGLLEIVCLKNTKLAETEDEMEEIATKYFLPYAYLFLLLHKMEKAVLATHKRVTEQEG